MPNVYVTIRTMNNLSDQWPELVTISIFAMDSEGFKRPAAWWRYFKRECAFSDIDLDEALAAHNAILVENYAITFKTAADLTLFLLKYT